MAGAGPVTVVCPACRQPVELPTRLTPDQDDRLTVRLNVDLQPATDHALTHAEPDSA